MKIFNTLTRKKEDFLPINKNEVKIYACGPTVYNYIHIGNARPICVFDVLRRYLIYKGYNVTFAQNYTDIDDKIIAKANKEGISYETLAQKYISEYDKDAKGLNVLTPDIKPKATENIDEIINIIKILIDKGYAYETENGDVYFNSLKFKDYGKLSHQPLDELEAGARIATGDLKKDPLDFALWKSAKPEEPSWNSIWSKGRPGWHIECSAMVKKYLGDTIDIHCGGQDLIFPHHENEIAQSECCSEKPFANYWMHNGYINVDNKKMSKSLNNFHTVRDISNNFGYEPIRYLMIVSHYRSPINFSIEILEQCISSIERLYNCKQNLEFILNNLKNDNKKTDNELEMIFENNRQDFIKAMDDDLNTANALASIFGLVKDINSNLGVNSEKNSKYICKFAYDMFIELTGILGLLYNDDVNNNDNKNHDEEINALIQKREFARKNKDFTTADKIRDELKERNIIIEDTPKGVKWSYIK